MARNRRCRSGRDVAGSEASRCQENFGVGASNTARHARACLGQIWVRVGIEKEKPHAHDDPWYASRSILKPNEASPQTDEVYRHNMS